MITPSDRRSTRNRRRRPLLAVPAAAGLLALAAACGSPGNSASSAASRSPAASGTAAAAAKAVGLKTAKVAGTTVLTSAKGFTLYTFAPDTATSSACNGGCAASWPPQQAPATVKSPYSKIKRSDGSSQLAYRGHPLYTYTGDSAPGQANGNGITAFGGLWHEATASGAPAPGSTSPGGGY